MIMLLLLGCAMFELRDPDNPCVDYVTIHDTCRVDQTAEAVRYLGGGMAVVCRCKAEEASHAP
jgi:hypothetical protein